MADLVVTNGGIRMKAAFTNTNGSFVNSMIRWEDEDQDFETRLYTTSSGQVIINREKNDTPTIMNSSLDLSVNNKGLYSRLTNGDRVAITSINDADNMYFGRPQSEKVGTILRGNFVRLQSVSGVSIESDRNLKENINNLDEKYEKFFYDLKPVSYKYILGLGKRKHLGFIAQDVEKALENNGLTNEDFAGICIDVPKYCSGEDDTSPDTYLIKNGIVDKSYSLIYTEFIALNTLAIQKQKEEIDYLKEKVNLLEKEIEKIKEIIL